MSPRPHGFDKMKKAFANLSVKIDKDEQIKAFNALIDTRSQVSPELAKVMDKEVQKIAEMSAVPSLMISGPEDKIKEILDGFGEQTEEEKVVTCKDNFGIEGWFNNEVGYVFKGYQGLSMEVYDLTGEVRVVDSVRFSVPRIEE